MIGVCLTSHLTAHLISSHISITSHLTSHISRFLYFLDFWKMMFNVKCFLIEKKFVFQPMKFSFLTSDAVVLFKNHSSPLTEVAFFEF